MSLGYVYSLISKMKRNNNNNKKSSGSHILLQGLALEVGRTRKDDIELSNLDPERSHANTH